MLHFSITSGGVHEEYSHASGPIEIGRGPRRDVQRLVVRDMTVSRDHLRVEELADGCIRVENISGKRPVMLADGRAIVMGAACSVEAPVRIVVGTTTIEVTIPTECGEAPLLRQAISFLAEGAALLQRIERECGEARDYVCRARAQVTSTLTPTLGIDEELAAARAAESEARRELHKAAAERLELQSELTRLVEAQAALAVEWRETEESLRLEIKRLTMELNGLRNRENGSATWL